MKNPALLISILCLGRSLAFAADQTPLWNARLVLIGEQRVPSREEVHGTKVGGLSGLDYDAARDEFVAITDDKVEFGPARFYTLRLDYDAHAFRAATVTDCTELRRPDGSAYATRVQARAGGGEAPDLESIRIDPSDGSVWYSSEGDGEISLQPFVRHASRAGAPLGEMSLPEMLRFDPSHHRGLRHNLVFEGITRAGDGSWWIGLEGPLYQDGTPPELTHGALVRFTHVAATGTRLGQIAYGIDPVPVAPGVGKLADNGVSEILTLDENRLLVLERAGIQGDDGRFRFHVKLFVADAGHAADVSDVASLQEGTVQPARKQLVLDFDRLGLDRVDNLEGLCWGRRLANGHRTLVLVSDDNFLANQVTQLLVFEVLAEEPRAWDAPFDGVVHDETRIAGFVGDFRWLSNYWPCQVCYEDRLYGSAEAAYHASKFPPEERDGFTKLDPDASKKRSRQKHVDAAWWDERKERVMREIVWAKFSQNPDLAAKLLATGDRRLEELNWWGDRFWGTVKGEGNNVLGQTLMDTRARLRHEPVSPHEKP